MDSELWRQRFAEHLRAYRRSEATIVSYGRQTVAFLDFLAARNLKEPHELTREDVEAYQVSLEHCRKADGEPLSGGDHVDLLGRSLMVLRDHEVEQPEVDHSVAASLAAFTTPIDVVPAPAPKAEQSSGR